MKRTAYFSLLISCLLLLVPSALHADDDSGLLTHKEVVENADGTYTLNLSTYVTGETITTTEDVHVPVDAVLVIDLTDDMLNPLTSSPVIATRKNTGSTFNPNWVDSGFDNLDITKPQGYYSDQVAGGYPRSIRYANNQWEYYEETFGSGWTKIEGNSMFSHAIYKSKLGAVMDAAFGFIDAVYNDAVANEVDSKISIVTFGGASSASVCADELSVTTSRSALKSIISSLGQSDDGNLQGKLQTHFGMDAAAGILTGVTRVSSKVAVLFTGTEYVGPTRRLGLGGWYDDYTNATSQFVDDAISGAKSIKDIGGLVYSIGAYNGTPNTNTANMLKYISSDYPKAASWSAPGSPASTTGYYQNAQSESDLSSIFTTIATETTTGGATVKMTESVLICDIITSNFVIQGGASASNITVWAIPHNGTSFSTNPSQWKSLNVSPRNALAPDLEVTVTSNTDGTKRVNVTGFDFSTYWCGSGRTATDPGYKLLIQIPIELSPNAPGGNMNTNAAGSGVYIDDLPLQMYEIPNVVLPSLVIQRTGLQPGESAVFIVTRCSMTDPDAKTYPATFTADAGYSYRVVVTNDGTSTSTPSVTLFGQKQAWYKVTEETQWAWPSQSQTQTVEQNHKFTSDTETQHTFTFSGSQKEANIFHHETKATRTYDN